jgi:hypothetical protein
MVAVVAVAAIMVAVVAVATVIVDEGAVATVIAPNVLTTPVSSLSAKLSTICRT